MKKPKSPFLPKDISEFAKQGNQLLHELRPNNKVYKRQLRNIRRDMR